MNILFLDTETGGLDPWNDSLLQVGALATINDEIVDVLEFNISLDKYTTCERAMNINNLNLDTLRKTGISPKQGVTKLTKFIKKNFGTDKPVLAGHNVAIDKYMIRKQLYSDNGLDMDDYISYRMIDTMAIGWYLVDAGVLPSHVTSGTALFKHFGIRGEALHTALSDAADTVILYKHLKLLLADYKKSS